MLPLHSLYPPNWVSGEHHLQSVHTYLRLHPLNQSSRSFTRCSPEGRGVEQLTSPLFRSCSTQRSDDHRSRLFGRNERSACMYDQLYRHDLVCTRSLHTTLALRGSVAKRLPHRMQVLVDVLLCTGCSHSPNFEFINSRRAPVVSIICVLICSLSRFGRPPTACCSLDNRQSPSFSRAHERGKGSGESALF